VVEGDGACAEEDQSKGEGSQSQGKFISAIAQQSVMEVYLGDGDGQIDADGKSRHAGKESDQYQQAAKKLGEGREISSPGRQSEAGDELNVVVKSAENLVVSVADHDRAKGQTHDQEGERLQTIQKAHGLVPPTERE